MKYRARILRLEHYRRQRLPPSHFVSVVKYPFGMDDGDVDRWLRDEVVCACGTIGCPELRIRILTSEPAPSVEAWEQWVKRQQARTPAETEAAREVWWRHYQGGFPDAS
jgi:hypothetical protein